MSGYYFDDVWKIDVTATDVKIIDGHIWVSNGTKVQVFNIWGDVDLLDRERSEWTELNKNYFRGAIKVKEFTVQNGAGKLINTNDGVWIANTTYNSMIKVNKDFSNVTGTTLYSGNSVVKLPDIMHSDMIWAYNKMWMVSVQKDKDGDVVMPAQKLWYWDGSTFNSTTIPDKPQQSSTRLVDGKNGFIYATRFNNVSVAKFASANGSYIGSIITNAEPISITVADDGIFVGSYAGMVSKINPTNDVVTHLYSTMKPAQDLVDTGDGYMWAVIDAGDGFIRIKKSDLTAVYNQCDSFGAAPAEDFKFEISDFTGNLIFNGLLATLPVTMTYWNGSAMTTTTAYQRLVFVSNSNIYIVRNYGTLNRKLYAECGAYGYITTGPYDYAGD